MSRLEHWLVLTRARAIENLSYVVACNAAGSSGGHEFAGNSVIIDPWGAVVARGSGAEMVVYGEIDLENVLDTRTAFRALEDRRWQGDSVEMKGGSHEYRSRAITKTR